MTVSTLSKFIHEDGSFSSAAQTNYGPISFGAGFVVSKIEVIGSLAIQERVLGSVEYFTSPYYVGVQYGESGYTPYDFVTEAEVDDHTWAFAHIIEPAASSAVWAPDTDNANWVDRYPFNDTHYYQLLTRGVVADFYLSMSVIAAADDNYRTFASWRMWFE